jgi:serine/threonine protein kinase
MLLFSFIINRMNCNKTYQTLSNRCNGHFHHTDIKLGEGAYGKIYQACCGTDCSYAMKVMEVDGNDHVDHEVAFQNALSRHGYAIPVYEIQRCHFKEAYVMDRLDHTLYDDLFALSPEQNQQMKTFYIDFYNNHVPDRIINEIRRYTTHKEYIKLYKRFGNTRDVRPQTVKDTPEQQYRKLKSLLLVLNLLDGVNQLNVKHHDTHLGNFMRKTGEDNYVLIDFGMAEQTPFTHKNTDVEMMERRIRKTIDRMMFYEDDYGNPVPYPLAHDLSYLVDAFPTMVDDASFEHTDRDIPLVLQKWKYRPTKTAKKKKKSKKSPKKKSKKR